MHVCYGQIAFTCEPCTAFMKSVIRFEDNPVTSLCISDNFSVFWLGCSVRGVDGTCIVLLRVLLYRCPSQQHGEGIVRLPILSVFVDVRS